jgi:hypothetical protein
MAQVPIEVLTQRYAVSYVPSGTVFARLREQHRAVKGGPLLALGDPCFSPATRTPPEPPGHGVLLRVVLPGQAAARAGLRAGDVLLSIGGHRLESPSDLEPASAALPAVARYWREGREHGARLAAGPLGVVVDPRSARAAVRALWRSEQPLVRERPHAELPGSRLEVEALARLVPGTSTLLGSRASAANLEQLARHDKLRHFRLLHLATHGVPYEDRPELSALILAQDRLPTRLSDRVQEVLEGHTAADGRLRVETILRTWKLDADLVVLSACQTGLGPSAGGNGQLGFTQALLARGARSVVLSRWKVDDAATALLMLRFYENLLGQRKGLKQPLPRSAALAEAKGWLRQLSRAEAGKLLARLAGGQLRGTIDPPLPEARFKPATLPTGDRPFAAPLFWAAFVLIGDPE